LYQLLFCPLVTVLIHSSKLLNSISATTDIATVSFFKDELDNTPAFKEKLDMLLTWSVTPLQYGDHRPFAAVTLIRLWRDKACERATRRDIETPNDFFQDQLFDWLDTSEVAGEIKSIRHIALLYEELVKRELFSYAKYIQRLIARGETGLSINEVCSFSSSFMMIKPVFLEFRIPTPPVLTLDSPTQFNLV